MNLERAAQLRDEGHPWRDVARQIGTTIDKLRREWTRAGRPEDRRYRSLRRDHIALTPADLENVLALRADRWPWKVIAKRVGIPPGVLQVLVCAAREPMPPEVLEAIRLRELGWRWKAIGRHLGYNSRTLETMISRYRRAGQL
jgi:lambda repressor-like predicted transcriptional regulator